MASVSEVGLVLIKKISKNFAFSYYYLDLTCTIQPWCLLATNSNIRQLFLFSKKGKIDLSNTG